MKGVRKILYGVIVVVLIAMSALYFFQEKLIFRPTQLPEDHTFQFSQPFEEIFLEGKERSLLNAVLLKAEDSKGLIIYYHGNSGDLSRWGEVGAYFIQFGYDVLVMDYRTYGKSRGKLSETSLYDDAQLFYYEALQRYDEEDIVVYGRSLGCTFASYVSARNNPSRLILETPFYSLADLVKSKYPVLPAQRLLKYQFPTASFVTRIDCPTAVIHGTDDAVVPYESGKKLYQTFSNGQTEFISISDGEHNNLVQFEAYQKSMERLLR